MKIALGVEYDGSGFCGWQTQAGVRAVQPILEQALAAVAARPIKVHCAGRTDSGVHALAQIVHFETNAARSPRAWTLGTNANLPADVSVLWAMPVPDDFHARFSAHARAYCYVICNRPTRAALWARKVTWECRPLQEQRMAAAARSLVGEHDFSSFRAAGCQSKHPLRNVLSLEVARCGDFVNIAIEANAFLQHMVRNIAGVLMAIGRSEREPDWAAEVLRLRDRASGGVTAAPDGLYFHYARYPARYGLPLTAVALPFAGAGEPAE